MENRYEAEIDLRDMCLYVLSKWRTLLLGAFLLGLLLGGYKLLLNTMETRGEAGKPQEIRLYEIALAQYELSKDALARDIKEYQMRLNEHKAYMDHSVLMATDPFHKPTASADIFVKLDGMEWKDLPDSTTQDPADSLIAIYTSNFHSNIDWKPIEDLTGLQEIYLRELFLVSADYNSNTFTIEIVYNDGALAQQLLDLVVDQILAKAPEVDANVNRHTLSVVSKSLAYSMDSSLADSQKSNADATAQFEVAILDCQNSLEDLIKPKHPHSVRKFFLLGAAGGFFLAAMFQGALYLLDGKLHNQRELHDRYGYPLLGTIPNFDSKAHTSHIDRFLGKLYGSSSCPSKDELCGLIGAKIAGQTVPGEKLLVTGTVTPEKLQAFGQSLLPKIDNVILMVAPNVNAFADSISTLAQCDAVILVEEQHKALITNIEKERENIQMFHKKVIGYVLL